MNQRITQGTMHRLSKQFFRPGNKSPITSLICIEGYEYFRKNPLFCFVFYFGSVII